MKYKLTTTYQQMLADTLTPVSMYLKIRDVFPQSILLESSDYHAYDKSFSYICCNPIAHFKVENEQIILQYPDSTTEKIEIKEKNQVIEELKRFNQSFEVEDQNLGFLHHGMFGFTSFDAVRYFDSLEFDKSKEIGLPDMHYSVYQNIIVVDHFHNQVSVFDHRYQNESKLDYLVSALHQLQFTAYPFALSGEVKSTITDEEFKEFVVKVKQHCQRGDVFQLVLSRRFSQGFTGDEFNVYRALRSVNPSPYLFYFDYGSFKIFGSSPEAQLVIKDQVAEIHPIAGTFKRTGDDESDAKMAQQLAKDPKENAEHVMLVDLARNDLSRNATDVKVEKYKEIQYFSHVIHLVSKVIGTTKDKSKHLQIVADTFPAGTLSGAPKYKALELINKYEPHAREAYGGAIGVIDFNGNYNHAIVIRSFVSHQQKLHFQAGAGIVVDSTPENELAEVNHKLGALKKALEMAVNN